MSVVEGENPEWLPMLSGQIAMYLREAVDEGPSTLTHQFPLLTKEHGLLMVQVRIVSA